MTENELTKIFGNLDAYIPLHEGKASLLSLVFHLIQYAFLTMCALNPVDLLMKLTEGTGPNGTVGQIGQTVIDWVCMAAC